MPYDLDDDDQQIALTLSEFPQVDKEVAGRLTKLESIKVHSIHSVMYDALWQVPKVALVLGRCFLFLYMDWW